MIDLHVHSDYSVLDGKQTIKDIVKYAKNNGENAIALTDHGNMVGTLKFYEECKANNIKAIIGCEFYYSNNLEDKNISHLILLAKNEVGYNNLLKLQYEAYMEGFYYKPRITHDMLKDACEGLICLSACIGGHIPKLVFKGEETEAINEVVKFKKLFKDDFFLEMQPHELDRQKTWNLFVEKMCYTFGANVVVTNDAHYVSIGDKDVHDTVTCMAYNKKKFDPDRFRYETTNEFKSEETIRKTLSYLDESILNSALDNTYVIADRCNVKIVTGLDLLPSISENPKKELANLCNKYYNEFVQKGEFNDLDINEVIKRIKYELKVINEKGYADYFIITWDFLEFCRKKDIPVGLGRGSIAGSMVAFLLGIHKLNPMRYGLLFERFLNPTRNSHVDVDSDFCYERRDEVVEYVANKYGRKNVSTVIAKGHMTTSNVVRKVLSAYGFESNVINTVSTKYIHKELGITLQQAYDKSIELKNFLDKNEEIRNACFELEDNLSHFSKHAAGVIIAPDDVYKYVPVMRDEDNINMMKTQWDKKEVERKGLYKFDFLGLKLLTTIGDTLKNIKTTKGKIITLDELYGLDVEDKVIYDILNSGQLNGIFQFSEYAGRMTIESAKPMCFEDVMACESICRPGVKEAELYKANRNLYVEHGTYPVPSYWSKVKHILENTYGAIVYQEQTMLLFNEIGGFTLGEADALRKVKSLDEYKERFIKSAVEKGFAPSEASELFERFNLEYSFNKSHAGVYGKTSCITAYLKGNYFIEYMSAYMSMEVLKSDKDSALKECMQECRSKGIKFIPPDINIATNKFRPIGEDKIMLPITFIKGLGDKAIEKIVSNRLYSSVEDFISKVPKKSVNATSLSKLIKAGSFDVFNTNRQSLLEKHSGYKEMFWCDDLKMIYEREVLGFNLGKHPLDGYVNVDFSKLKDETVSINAIITEVIKKIDKNGKEYAFIKLENKESIFEGIMFSYVYQRLHSVLLTNSKVNIQGNKNKGKLLIDKMSLI